MKKLVGKVFGKMFLGILERILVDFLSLHQIFGGHLGGFFGTHDGVSEETFTILKNP